MRHIKRMGRIVQARSRSRIARRSAATQRYRRRAERIARRSAVKTARLQGREGASLREIGVVLGIDSATLGRWVRGWREDQMRETARGRHLVLIPDERRRAIVDLLAVTQAGIGLPRLRALFPDVARSPLVDLLRR